MKYYKVKNDKGGHRLNRNLETVPSELFTEKELSRFKLSKSKQRELFIELEVNKNQTYFSFGCRFLATKGQSNIKELKKRLLITNGEIIQVTENVRDLGHGEEIEVIYSDGSQGWESTNDLQN